MESSIPKRELIPIDDIKLLKFEMIIRTRLSNKKYVKWNCSACTFENLICQAVCQICDTERITNNTELNSQTD